MEQPKNPHCYKLNRKQLVITHLFWDWEQIKTKKNTKDKSKKRGAWISKGTIPVIKTTVGCKHCDGTIYGPPDLPTLFTQWGICGKCGSEWVENKYWR